MIEQLIILAILIFFSGIFSGAETALFSLSDAKVHNLVENGRKNAKILEKLKKDPHKLLTILLISNNLVNIAASALATVIGIKLFGAIGPGISTGVMIFLVLIFGEITPKSIAITHNEKISLTVAKPILFFSYVIFPLVYIFVNISKITTKMFDSDKKEPSVSPEELKAMATLGAKEGAIGSDEKRMIHGVLRLEHKDVYGIMTPRNQIFALNMNNKINDVIDKILENGYSRIPIYEKKSTNIKGIIYVKDILKQLHEKKNLRLSEIMIKPFIVPELKKVDDLLDEFKRKKVHMALVVNEHGDISGLVTIEDLLEEIVGEIYDETDVEERLIKKINDNTFIVSGRSEIEDVSKQIHIDLKKYKDGDFSTINGLILYKTGKIPQKGEKIHFDHFTIIVNEREKNRVVSARIIKK